MGCSVIQLSLLDQKEYCPGKSPISMIVDLCHGVPTLGARLNQAQLEPLSIADIDKV